jgi:hypothetical protein
MIGVDRRREWPLVVASTTTTKSAWHISPAVDFTAYHFGWLLFFVPMALLGGRRDYLVLWVLGGALSFAHRFLSLPYVYMDRQIFEQHAARFVVVPMLAIAGLLSTTFLWSWRVPVGFFGRLDLVVLVALLALAIVFFVLDRARIAVSTSALGVMAVAFAVPIASGFLGYLKDDRSGPLGATLVLAVAALALFVRGAGRLKVGLVAMLAALAVLLAVFSMQEPAFAWPNESKRLRRFLELLVAFAALWNIWHVYMQKYGILRMYNAKIGGAVPGWVDRLFVFGWFPLYVAWIGPHHRHVLEKHAKEVGGVVLPLVDVLEKVSVVLVPLGVAILAASLVLFTVHERRAGWNRTRVSMAVGTTMLGAATLVEPLKGYIAFGFAHALEYVVFVWAFQRRRYAQAIEPVPLLGRMLRGGPVLFYGAFFIALMGTRVFLDWGDDTFYSGELRIFGVRAGAWLLQLTVWGSLVHFYYDGFLWKMRHAHVRAAI